MYAYTFCVEHAAGWLELLENVWYSFNLSFRLSFSLVCLFGVQCIAYIIISKCWRVILSAPCLKFLCQVNVKLCIYQQRKCLSQGLSCVHEFTLGILWCYNSTLFYEDLERDEIKMPYVARGLVCMHWGVWWCSGTTRCLTFVGGAVFLLQHSGSRIERWQCSPAGRKQVNKKFMSRWMQVSLTRCPS